VYLQFFHWIRFVLKTSLFTLFQVQVGSDSKTFTPEEISAMVLTKMKETAEAYLGKKVTQGDCIQLTSLFVNISPTLVDCNSRASSRFATHLILTIAVLSHDSCFVRIVDCFYTPYYFSCAIGMYIAQLQYLSVIYSKKYDAILHCDCQRDVGDACCGDGAGLFQWCSASGNERCWCYCWLERHANHQWTVSIVLSWIFLEITFCSMFILQSKPTT